MFRQHSLQQPLRGVSLCVTDMSEAFLEQVGLGWVWEEEERRLVPAERMAQAKVQLRAGTRTHLLIPSLVYSFIHPQNTS